MSQDNVSSDTQQKVKSEFSDALKSLSESGAQIEPSQVKEALSSVLTANGLDGESFVRELGTPPTRSSGTPQSTQVSLQRRPGGGPPPPPPSSTSTEASATSETEYLQQLIDLLTESISDSTGTSTSQASQDVRPGNYINRGGGNLDVSA